MNKIQIAGFNPQISTYWLQPIHYYDIQPDYFGILPCKTGHYRRFFQLLKNSTKDKSEFEIDRIIMLIDLYKIMNICNYKLPRREIVKEALKLVSVFDNEILKSNFRTTIWELVISYTNFTTRHTISQ